VDFDMAMSAQRHQVCGVKGSVLSLAAWLDVVHLFGRQRTQRALGVLHQPLTA
jgi:hypothetical protein